MISTEDYKDVFTGNGSTTTFDFDFKAFSEAGIRVIHLNVTTGATTELTNDTDYTLVLNSDQENDPGGTVTYPVSGSALSATEKLAIVRGDDFDQTTDFFAGMAMQTVEDRVDYLTALCQQLLEKANRSVRVGVIDGGLSAFDDAVARAGKYIRFTDDTAALPEAVEFTEVGTVLSYSVITSYLGSQQFGAGDTTPSVLNHYAFRSNTSSLTITDFDDGYAGQTITVYSLAAITFDTTGTNLTGSPADLVTASGDYTRWINVDGTTWRLLEYNGFPVVQTFGSADTSPSVLGQEVFETGGSTLTINDFDDGEDGQVITVISKAAITYDTTGTNLTSPYSVDLITKSGDVTQWICDGGTTWRLVSFNGNAFLQGLVLSVESLAPTGTTTALAYNNGPAADIDLESASGNVTVTIGDGPTNGYGCYQVRVRQDSAVARTVTFTATGTIYDLGGTPHPMTTTLDGFTLYTLETWNGTDWFITGGDYS